MLARSSNAHGNRRPSPLIFSDALLLRTAVVPSCRAAPSHYSLSPPATAAPSSPMSRLPFIVIALFCRCLRLRSRHPPAAHLPSPLSPDAAIVRAIVRRRSPAAAVDVASPPLSTSAAACLYAAEKPRRCHLSLIGWQGEGARSVVQKTFNLFKPSNVMKKFTRYHTH